MYLNPFLKGHVDAVNVLLKAGADPNANNIGGQTAVHYAAFQGNLDIMRALLAHGANLKIKNQDDQTGNFSLTPSPSLFVGFNQSQHSSTLCMSNGQCSIS